MPRFARLALPLLAGGLLPLTACGPAAVTPTAAPEPPAPIVAPQADTGTLRLTVHGFGGDRRVQAVASQVETVAITVVDAKGVSREMSVGRDSLESGVASATMAFLPVGMATATVRALDADAREIGQAAPPAVLIHAGQTTPLDVTLKLNPTHTYVPAAAPPSGGSGGDSAGGHLQASVTLQDGDAVTTEVIRELTLAFGGSTGFGDFMARRAQAIKVTNGNDDVPVTIGLYAANDAAIVYAEQQVQAGATVYLHLDAVPANVTQCHLSGFGSQSVITMLP